MYKLQHIVKKIYINYKITEEYAHASIKSPLHLHIFIIYNKLWPITIATKYFTSFYLHRIYIAEEMLEEQFSCFGYDH